MTSARFGAKGEKNRGGGESRIANAVTAKEKNKTGFCQSRILALLPLVHCRTRPNVQRNISMSEDCVTKMEMRKSKALLNNFFYISRSPCSSLPSWQAPAAVSSSAGAGTSGLHPHTMALPRSPPPTARQNPRMDLLRNRPTGLRSRHTVHQNHRTVPPRSLPTGLQNHPMGLHPKNHPTARPKSRLTAHQKSLPMAHRRNPHTGLQRSLPTVPRRSPRTASLLHPSTRSLTARPRSQ